MSSANMTGTALSIGNILYVGSSHEPQVIPCTPLPGPPETRSGNCGEALLLRKNQMCREGVVCLGDNAVKGRKVVNR